MGGIPNVDQNKVEFKNNVDKNNVESTNVETRFAEYGRINFEKKNLYGFWPNVE